MVQIIDGEGTQEILRQVQVALAQGSLEVVRSGLHALHPSEIADLLESLPPEARATVWDLIDPILEGEVLAAAQDEVRAGLLATMAPHEVAAAATDLDSDEVADILQDLPPPMVDEVLRAMDTQNRERVTSALSYAEDTAGGLMRVETQTIRADVEVDVVLRYLRFMRELPENIDSLLVVDRENNYLGALPLSVLVTQDPERTVAEVMVTEIEGIPADLPAAEVVRLFEQRDLLSAAVVDQDNKLLGRITIDDVVDVLRDQGDHSLLGMAGLDEEHDIFAPFAQSIRRRALWLGINLLTCFLAAQVIGVFRDTISHLVALAILMPTVASMGGIAGTQTLTIVIRGLALDQVGRANFLTLLGRELLVGLGNSLLWATVLGLAAYFWFGDPYLGLVIAAALSLNVLAAVVVGAMLPMVLTHCKVDPAIAGGVLLTTVTDMLGFFTFLGLATVFLLP